MGKVEYSSETVSNYCELCNGVGGFIKREPSGLYHNKIKVVDGVEVSERIELHHDVWTDCTCLKAKRANALMESSRITGDFQKMRFSNFEEHGRSDSVIAMKKTAHEYLANFKGICNTRQGSIVLVGQSGAGKTHLLSAVSNTLIERLQVPVLYFPYVEGMEELKDSFNVGDNEKTLNERMNKLKNVAVLFIDDLFKPVNNEPQFTKWEVKKMYEIINYRYLNNLPILVSTEVTFDAMLDIDEALATRIFEMCENYYERIAKNIKNNYRLRNMFKGD